MRQAARHWKRTDIDQQFDSMCLQEVDQFVDGSGGMANGVNRHRMLSNASMMTASCSGETVLRSIWILSASIRTTMGGSCCLNRFCNSAALNRPELKARRDVGSVAVGAVPPPITDSPARTSTSNCSC